MNTNCGAAVICRGFTNYCGMPKFIGNRRIMFRTSVVINKRDFFDEWDVYDDLFWRMVTAVLADVADGCRIKAMDQTAPLFDTFSEFRAWQARQKTLAPEFVVEPPGEIEFFSVDRPICLMEFEDWSDIVKHEPYACSFTFSFYSDNKNVDARIEDVLHRFLLADKEISEIATVNECPSPKWYWPLLNVMKSDGFFICVGLVVLVLFALVMIIISP